MNTVNIKTPTITKIDDGIKTLKSYSFENSSYQEILKKILIELGGMPLIIIGDNLPGPQPPLYFYRARKESTINESEDLTSVSTFSYPNPSIVNVKMGRANREGAPVFYGTDSRTTAILETIPQSNEIVYLGYWKIIETRYLRICPIASGTLKAGPFLEKFMKNFDYDNFFKRTDSNGMAVDSFKHLLFELSKLFVSDNYLITSTIAHSLLYDEKKGVNLLMYPSVANKHMAANFAFSTNVCDLLMKCTKVYKLKYLSSTWQNFHAELLQVGIVSPDTNLIEWRDANENDEFEIDNVR